MSALINLGGDRFKLDQSFVTGSVSVSVNGQKLGSWKSRKNASCNAKIGERDYLVRSTKISKGSNSLFLQIEIAENGNLIHSGSYNQYGVPVSSVEDVKKLDSARMGWCLLFGIIGVIPGGLLASRLVADPGLFFDINGGIFVGGLLGALGALIGFLIGHRFAVFSQRGAMPMLPGPSAHTSSLFKNTITASSLPTSQPRRLITAGTDTDAGRTEDAPGALAGDDPAKPEPEESRRAPMPALNFSTAIPVQVAKQPGKPIDGPSGVGGWLLFFCLCITILGPLVTLWQMLVGWEQAEPAFDLFPTIKTVLVWSYLGTGAIMIYGIIVGVVILGGSSQGREIARTFLMMRPLLFLAVEAIALLVVFMGDLPSEATIAGIFGAIGSLFREAVFFTIWWFYFKRSRRVRNTYGFEA